MLYYIAVGLVVAVVCMIREHDDTLDAWDAAGVLLVIGMVACIAWPAVVLRFIVTRS
jgi:hypothetical protein